MGISYSVGAGVEVALDASRILEEAWSPPALHYTPEYLRWQLGFPGSYTLPSVVAVEGSDLVGFAAATNRRVRLGTSHFDVAVVSFVAVRPLWQNRGVAAGLYRSLLVALKQIGAPVVTYTAAGSGAERVALRAYAEAGFHILPLGAYPVYTFLARDQAPQSEWQASVSDQADVLPVFQDGTILWADPSPAQFAHYFEDPRPRHLIALTTSSGTPAGAAWAVRTEFRVQNRGLDTVTAVESVSLPRRLASGLPVILRCAAAAWASNPPVVTVPSLNGFDPGELRTLGIRHTGASFHGYLCSTRELPEDIRGTSLEVI